VDREGVFAATTRMRRELADLLAGLDDARLATPSLCAGWDVLTCAAHTAAGLTGSTAGFLVSVVRYGGPHRATTGTARRLAAHGRDAVVAALREQADRRVAPPGVREYGPFTDQIVHGLDIRRPLGLAWEPGHEEVRAALDFLTGDRAFGFVRRGVLDGLRFEAQDVPFTSGDGPQLRGRGVDLAAAVCGRVAVLDDLRGDGVAVLRGRLS
jgi:uncharacterized protein (TIGR03083 family)